VLQHSPKNTWTDLRCPWRPIGNHSRDDNLSKGFSCQCRTGRKWGHQVPAKVMPDFRRPHHLIKLNLHHHTIHLLIASMALLTPQKNKQASNRQVQSPLATARNPKRVRKKYNTPARARYFETLSTRSERNKSIEVIDKEHRIDSKTVPKNQIL